MVGILLIIHCDTISTRSVNAHMRSIVPKTINVRDTLKLDNLLARVRVKDS